MQSVDQELAVWQRELPDLDVALLAPILHALRLGDSVGTFRRRVVEPFEVRLSEYDVLTTLRRAGTPYRLNPSAISKRLDRSSGGVTKLLKRLEEGGYLERSQDPEDGRGSLVTLTRRGLELQGRIFGAFVAAAGNRFEGLGKARLAEVEASMKLFLEALER